MQSFTTQSLASQLQENPFDSPHLLACLIVPHLATYLSVNASLRFLILEYPAEHLATIVALQNLIGVDVLKIAGIIDSEAASAYNTEPSSPGSSLRLSSSSAMSSSAAQLARSLDAISLPGSPFPHPFPLQSPFGAGPTLTQRRRLSFSKANYVLTNTATEAEIAGFISIIWRILIQADPFYVPEHGHLPMGGNRAMMGSRYPTTKASNCSLVSSKFAPTSTAPSTPSTPSPSAHLNHPCYPYWGLAGSLVSPPSSRGSGAGEQPVPMTIATSSLRRAVPRSSESVDFPHAPPLFPVPPPPSSSRSESPNGTSLRSAKSRDLAGIGAGSSHNGNFSASSTLVGATGMGGGNVATTTTTTTTITTTTTTTPAVVSPGAGPGAGGFSLRSKSLNRILATRRGRKASSGGTSTPDPTISTPPSPSVGSGAPFATTKTTTTTTSPAGNEAKMALIDGRENFLAGGPAAGAGAGADTHGSRGVPGGISGDATSTYAVSLADDGDFYDDEERRLMPMYLRQGELRRGNSRKALKWLGLA